MQFFIRLFHNVIFGKWFRNTPIVTVLKHYVACEIFKPFLCYILFSARINNTTVRVLHNVRKKHPFRNVSRADDDHRRSIQSFYTIVYLFYQFIARRLPYRTFAA